MKLSEGAVWWNQPITWGPKYIPSLIWHLYFQIHVANSMTWFFLVYPRVFRRSVDDTSHLFVRPIHYGFANFDIGKARYKWGGQVEIRILVGNNSIVTSYVASKGHVHVCAGTLSYIIYVLHVYTILEAVYFGTLFEIFHE